MSDSKPNPTLFLIAGIDIMVIVAVIGLFLKVNQLQQIVSQLVNPPPPGLELHTSAPPFTL